MSIKAQVNSLAKSIIGNTPNKIPSYRYPLNDVDKYQNIIKFTAKKRDEKSSSQKFTASPTFSSSKLGSVNLYMPAALQINDNLSYDNVDTALGGMAVNAYQDSAGLGELLKTVRKDLSEVGDRVVSQMLATASQNRSAVSGIAGQLLINRGEVVNPHTQMLFRSPALRQFNFSFKMMPRTRAEAKEILSIVKFFREAAYPSLAFDGSSSELDPGNKKSLNMSSYKFPDVFEIEYLTNHKVNTNLIKFADAYITAVSVNYNQTSPTFFDDGMPSEIDLSLTFQETKALSREDIVKGY
jgi:hypothetical protein